VNAAVISSSNLFWQAFASKGEYYIERKEFVSLKKEHPPQRSPGLIETLVKKGLA